jgi:hypothetical protein
MINWKAILTGFILTVIFALILNPFIGEFGSYISIVIAGIVVGYLVKGNLTSGAIHGALIGIIGAIIAIIILFIIGGFLILKAEIFNVLVRIIVDMVLGAIGGALGTIFVGRKH